MAETFWVVNDGRLDPLGSGKRYRSEAETRADMAGTNGLFQVIKGLPSEIKPAAPMAELNASLEKLQQAVESIGNPKNLQRRWQLISVVDDVYEPCAPPESWSAVCLLTELREWLEHNDGDSAVRFQTLPAREATNC